MDETFDIAAEIKKVDTDLGLVFGWAIICKNDGVEYFDLHGDHVPEASMLPAAADFMLNSRIAKDMHVGDRAGEIVFAWPMTEDIAKAFGVTTKNTGLMIAMKPSTPALLQKFADGDYTGFSIGGRRISEKVIENA